MNKINKKIIPIILIGFFISNSGLSIASVDGPLTFVIMPARYITVKGDAAKFRAITWMNDGYTAGIKEMNSEQKIGKDTLVSFDGHAIAGDNDFRSNLMITKNNMGYLKLNYGNFRKYYDVYGGYFPDYTSSSSINRMDADPKLDIGNFLFEIGSTINDEPGISLSFERHSREGIKSSLTWNKVVVGSRTKYIYPTSEEVSLVSDAINLKANAELADINISGQQKVEFFGGRTYREEKPVPYSGTNYLQGQEKEPQSIQLLTSLKADKWIIDDKTYVAFAYQFQHVKNNELETLQSTLSTGALGGGRNRLNKGKTSYSSNTWVQHFVQNITDNLSTIFKLKEELIERRGSSVANTFNSSGAFTSSITSKMENKTARMGESISVRYSGIPKTSLYGDLELSQMRNWISDERGTTFINAINKGPEGTGTVGVRYTLSSKMNMTSQIRHKKNNNNYNTLQNTDNGWAFGRLHIDTTEWSNRLTVKPCKWFENSFRLQLIDNIFHTQNLGQSSPWTTSTDWLKSQSIERIYTYDMVIQPLDQWLIDLAYSMNNVKLSTPAAERYPSAGGIPAIRTNVQSVLGTLSYTPKDNLSFFNSYEYSWAKNFDSQGYVGLPYGIDNRRYEISLGLKWSPKKSISLEPHYGYYAYKANQSIEYGNYTAHIIWLDAKFDW